MCNPLQKITSGMKSIFLDTLSYLLTPQNIERKQGHRKLFKLVRHSILTPRQTGKEVVTVRAVLLQPKINGELNMFGKRKIDLLEQVRYVTCARISSPKQDLQSQIDAIETVYQQ